MRLFLPVFAALALPVAAQGYTGTAAVAGQLRAQVWQGAQYAEDTLALGTPITNVTVSKSLNLPSGRADASATFTFGRTGRRSTLTITESTLCNPGTQYSTAHCGTHATRVTIQPAGGAPLYGYFTLRYSTVTNVGTNVGAARIDLFENGSLDFSAPVGSSQVAGHAVLVPAAGMRVLVTTSVQSTAAQAPATSSYQGRLEVEFKPITRCQFRFYGTGCGPVLTGFTSLVDATTRTLRYDVRSAPVSAPAILIFGGTRQSAPLGGGCFLNTVPSAFALLPTGPTGTASLTVTTRTTLAGLVHAQFIAFDGAALRSSRGLDTDCRWRP